MELNKYAINIFSFFIIQLFLRIISISLLLKARKILVIDITISVLLFLITFYKFIINQIFINYA
jgi:hypothetical protein